jgi:hypothetical protein
MARGSRDLAKFLQIENGKRFRGLSQISTKPNFHKTKMARGSKGLCYKKRGVASENRREGFSPSPLQRGREKKLSAAARHPPEPKKGRLV